MPIRHDGMGPSESRTIPPAVVMSQVIVDERTRAAQPIRGHRPIHAVCGQSGGDLPSATGTGGVALDGPCWAELHGATCVHEGGEPAATTLDPGLHSRNAEPSGPSMGGGTSLHGTARSPPCPPPACNWP